MIEKTFESFDKFDRKPFAERLTKVITTFYPFSDEAYVLSLDAEFGSGKTTFLDMWKNYLIEHEYEVISLNAWETDFDEEPLIPIMSILLDNISDSKVGGKLKEGLLDALGTLMLASNQAIKKVSGIDVYDIQKTLNDKNLQKAGDNIYKEFSFKKKAYHHLKKCLTEYINELPNKPLIIFVDELDRVRPDYAVEFLETIKHIFAVQGVCFVLAVDRSQLEKSVKQLYGDIDFNNYYRRFVTREATLPSSNKVELSPFIEQLAVRYFDAKEASGVCYPFASGSDRQSVLKRVGIICRIFRMTPRNIEHLFRIYSQFLAIENKKTGSAVWMFASIFLIAVFITKKDLYHALGSSSLSPKTLHSFIENLDFTWIDIEYERIYIIEEAIGFALTDNPIYIKEAKEIILQDKQSSEEMFDRLIREIYGHRGYTKISGFQRIYTLLESWRSFIE